MKLKKISQKGFLHLHSLLPIVLVMVAIGGVGAYVLQKSKAGSNPFINGNIIQEGGEVYADPYTVSTESVKGIRQSSQEKFPTECYSGMNSTGRISWNATTVLRLCATNMTYGTTKTNYRTSLIAADVDGSNARILWGFTLNWENANVNSTENYNVDNFNVIKDGSLSKIAFSDARGAGDRIIHKLGIYDVTTAQTTYLSSQTLDDMSLGGFYNVDWSPDLTKLYFLSGYSLYCTVTISDSSTECFSPTNSELAISHINSAWTYDMSYLYGPLWRKNADGTQTNEGFGRYSLAENKFEQVMPESMNVKIVSPDSKLLVLYDLQDNLTKLYDIDKKTIVKTNLGAGDFTWLAKLPDTQAPTTPGSLTATTTNTTVNLKWSASSDNNTVASYEIKRNGQVVGSVQGNLLAYTDSTAPKGTGLTYTVTAKDTAGNVSAPSNTASITIVRKSFGDMDGNGTSDIALYRPNGNQWWTYHADMYAAGKADYVVWGSKGDSPVPGDYNGDNKVDLSVFRASNATWYIRNVGTYQHGTVGDAIPVPADYNGDGKTDIAVFRPSNGTWYVRGQFSQQFGGKGDVPIPKDYNGDGKTDLAIYRPSTRAFYIFNAADYAAGNNKYVVFGNTGDIPVPADYNGDGKAEIATFRPSTGYWLIRGGTNAQFGYSKDIPIPADYNGDGKDDLAVFRTTDGTWYIKDQRTQQYGWTNDVPVQLPYAIKKYLYPTYGN